MKNMNEIIEALRFLINEAKDVWSSPLSFIKNVYYWDPWKLPESSLPAVLIAPDNSSYIKRWSRVDEKSRTLNITIVIDRRKLFETDQVDATKIRAIEQVSEGMEKTLNKKTLENTICWIVQQNPKLQYNLGSWIVAPASNTNVLAVDYAISDERWFQTYEATANIAVNTIWDR